MAGKSLQEISPLLSLSKGSARYRLCHCEASYKDVPAKKSHSDEFISKLEKGYQTEVGNKGENLSVGQKQRLAIARALVKNPKILILDEATSNIDAISEKYIMDTIYNLPEDMLVIIVAHRLSTIRYCDKIVILENGEIVESGSHELLMEKAGKYFEMLNINERTEHSL